MKVENEDIEQLLEHLKNGKTFRVPENYFEDFAERLRARIEQESKPARRITWFMYLKPALGIAAVLIIAFLLIEVPVNLSLRDQKSLTDNKNNVTTSKPSDEAVVTSISDELTVSFESLVQLSQSQFLSTLEQEVNQDETSPIDPKALEQYLADNSFDYEIIGNN